MISTKQFFEMITSCSVVSPKKDCRYYLNGIHLVQNEYGLTVESTDGHRLIRFETPCKFQGVEEFDVILDIQYVKPMLDKMKALNYHKTDITEVEVTSVSDGFINFNFETVKLVDGRYADCKRVIWGHDKQSRPITEYGINLEYLADIAKIQKPFKTKSFVAARLEFKSEIDSMKFTFNTSYDDLTVIGLIMPCRL